MTREQAIQEALSRRAICLNFGCDYKFMAICILGHYRVDSWYAGSLMEEMAYFVTL